MLLPSMLCYWHPVCKISFHQFPEVSLMILETWLYAGKIENCVGWTRTMLVELKMRLVSVLTV